MKNQNVAGSNASLLYGKTKSDNPLKNQIVNDLISSRFKKSSVKAFTNFRILSKYFPNFGIFRKKLKEAGLKQSASNFKL